MSKEKLLRRVVNGCETFRCTNCRKWRTRAEFGKHTLGWGIESRCKDCRTEAWRERYYGENREAIRKRERERQRALRKEQGPIINRIKAEKYAKKRGLIPPGERTWGNSYLYKHCQKCKEVAREHYGRGLCTRCYCAETRAGRIHEWEALTNHPRVKK